jgi:hypothetical protein
MNHLRSALRAGLFGITLSLATATGACTVQSTTASETVVAGTWNGAFHDSKTNVVGPFQAVFTDVNGSVNGTLTITNGWLCSVANQGNVTGSLSGSELSAQTSFGLATGLSFNGSLQGNQIAGTYSITSGVCAGGSGTFTMDKQ